jgi:hypothetical protein
VPAGANLLLSLSTPVIGFTGSAAMIIPSADLRLTLANPVSRFTVQWSATDGPACPGEITVELITETKSGGRSFTGKKQNIQSDAGFWRIVLGQIRIRSNLDVLAWRERELLLNGRSNTMLVPIHDRKRAPIPPGGAPIIATTDDPVARGGVAMNIKVTQGAALEPGMHFSTGERLYRLRTVGTPAGSPPVYPVTFRPPAREAIADNAALEFEQPVCRCRLETDDAMNAALDLMKYATPTVPFVEDY